MNTGHDYNNIKIWLLGDPDSDSEGLLSKTGLSVEKLARAAGITRTSLYFYLSDQSRPTPERMTAICNVLGVPAEEGLAQYTPRKVGRPKA